MLGLTLREEFRSKRLKGAVIELSNDQHTGATQIAAKQFLEITYPTYDLLKGIEGVGPNQGRPEVVIGERGLGKSHLMAAHYHALADQSSTGSWLNARATKLGVPSIGKIALRNGMHVIGDACTGTAINSCGTCCSTILRMALSLGANEKNKAHPRPKFRLTN